MMDEELPFDELLQLHSDALEAWYKHASRENWDAVYAIEQRLHAIGAFEDDEGAWWANQAHYQAFRNGD